MNHNARPTADTPYVFDGHNDFAWAMRDAVGYDLSLADPLGGLPDLHTDIPRLRQGSVGAQFWSLWVPSAPASDALARTLEQLDFIRQLTTRYPDAFSPATTAGDVEAAQRRGTIASLLGIEGGHSIANSLGVLRIFRALGVRYMTLTHTRNNDWADSATDTPVHGGLSDFGRTVVAEMERIGVLVDLSHVAESVMSDVLDIATKPAIFSHSSAKALCDVPRNVSDDILTRLTPNGGVCMATFVPQFLSAEFAEWFDRTEADAKSQGLDAEAPEFLAFFMARASERPVVTLDDAVRHVNHIRDVAGVQHVGIGGDFDGTPFVTEGLEDVSTYPALFEALRKQRWTDDELIALAHGNIMRVLRDAG